MALKDDKLQFTVLAICNFGTALCIAPQAPFFPEIAERKGFSPNEYGIVFGVHYLIQFLVSPILGRYMTTIGSKRMLIAGATITGIACICFGVADLLVDKSFFMSWCITSRVVGAIGATGETTAIFSILGCKFQEQIGLASSLIESTFAFGFIVGPVLGGLLYDLGGYILPFIVIGSFQVLSCIMVLFSLKLQMEDVELERLNAWNALKIPAVTLSLFSAFVGMSANGFLSVNFEPYIRHFNLSSTLVGFLFFLIGASQFITNPIAGKLYDLGLSSHLLLILSCVIEIVSFSLLAPLPIFPFEASFLSVALVMVFHGIGFGIQVIIPLAAGQKFAVQGGLPDNLSTFSLISGLWSTFFAIGAFLGSLLTTYLREKYDFNTATYYVLSANVILLLFHLTFWIKSKRVQK